MELGGVGLWDGVLPLGKAVYWAGCPTIKIIIGKQILLNITQKPQNIPSQTIKTHAYQSLVRP